MIGATLGSFLEQLSQTLPPRDPNGLNLSQLAVASATNRLQALVDLALSEAPITRQQLSQLDDGTLAISVTEPTVEVQLSVIENRLNLQLYLAQEHAEQATRSRAQLTGSASALAALMGGEQKHSFAGTGVAATGDLVWLGQFNALLTNIDIDWGGILARPFGDVAGHLLAKGAKAAVVHGRRTLERSATNAVEVLQQEWQWLPTRASTEKFDRQLLELRRGADRLQAKIDYTLRQRQRDQSEQS